VLKGSFTLDGKTLETRDGLGIWDTDSFTLESLEDASEILLMEVPMN
jgi:redox-sensitive bicupin YhaK (pirin superfamily)